MSPNNWIAIETVHDHILRELDGVFPTEAWGETSYFYNPGHVFDHGAYFATIKQRNGPNDSASQLDRRGVWRLNMGVSKAAYFELFGPPPHRPGKGVIIASDWDFAALDTFTPHPVYGWMSWVAVLNPSEATWARCVRLLQSAHSRAMGTFDQRLRRSKLR